MQNNLFKIVLWKSRPRSFLLMEVICHKKRKYFKGLKSLSRDLLEMSGARNSLLWKNYFLQGQTVFIFKKIQEIRYQAPGLPKVSSINEPLQGASVKKAQFKCVLWRFRLRPFHLMENIRQGLKGKNIFKGLESLSRDLLEMSGSYKGLWKNDFFKGILWRETPKK